MDGRRGSFLPCFGRLHSHAACLGVSQSSQGAVCQNEGMFMKAIDNATLPTSFSFCLLQQHVHVV